MCLNHIDTFQNIPHFIIVNIIDAYVLVKPFKPLSFIISNNATTHYCLIPMNNSISISRDPSFFIENPSRASPINRLMHHKILQQHSMVITLSFYHNFMRQVFMENKLLIMNLQVTPLPNKMARCCSNCLPSSQRKLQ